MVVRPRHSATSQSDLDLAGCVDGVIAVRSGGQVQSQFTCGEGTVSIVD